MKVKAAPKARSAKRRHAEFIKADLLTRVRMATPLARELVTLGVCDVKDVCIPDNMELVYHIEELIGHSGPELVVANAMTPLEHDQVDVQVWQSQAAAYALGIAVGLLLRPDAFTGGDR